MIPKICVSILPETINEALELIEKAENQKVDFIEVRLDCLRDHEKLADIAGSSRVPLIATIRTQNWHGKFLGKESERQRILANAARNGFDYVDIEISTSDLKKIVSNLRQMNVKSIISFHDYEGTPPLPKIQEIFEREVEEGAEICKIVTTAKFIEDNLTLLNFLLKASKRAKVVCFAMGSLGKTSRLLSPLFGGFFTIASLDRGKETAPGQMTIQELKTIYQALGEDLNGDFRGNKSLWNNRRSSRA